MDTGRKIGRTAIRICGKLLPAGKRMAAVCVLLLFTAVIYRTGKPGLAADFIAQPSWRLLCAAATPEGIRVETAGENLVLRSGVRTYADSTESSAFSADKVRDGICEEKALRWSSENDWENNEHWLMIAFPGEITAGFVRIYWERTNACAYTLEYSSDKKNWTAAAEFFECPKEKQQDIVLKEPVRTKYLRLHVTDVAKREEDLSLYYQNISVLEFEVYEGIEDTFVIEKPIIPEGSRRRLALDKEVRQGQETVVWLPQMPEGYELEFVGADYDNLVEADGRIADTIADTVVELGFSLQKDGTAYELPGMETVILASCQQPGEGEGELPPDYEVMEWEPHSGSYRLGRQTRVVIPKAQEEALLPTAKLFARELSDRLGFLVEAVVSEEEKDPRYGMEAEDIYLSLWQEDDAQKEESDWIDGLGKEGFWLCLQSASREGTQICGTSAQGVRWGCVSFLSLWDEARGELPKGQIRDYPRYSVRGFGIDVGRRAISLELLYRIVEEMSRHKMNTLQVHLNDNQIISQSGYDGTRQGALGLYAGFRLESDIRNERGEGITSTDYYYTKEEFAQFIEDASAYGVEVVPEIDTPAHSLALTKVFPHLGLLGDPEGADQLDLAKEETVALGKAIWSEYLTDDGNGAVFGSCSSLHLGMDEYFGNEKDYISYLTELAGYVKELAPDKGLRIWGSLSKIQADHQSVPKNLEMHIWDTDWADPERMYEEGFSIINSQSSSLYLIPGGGYDWLDQAFLEEKWQPNRFETAECVWELPAYSPKMLGSVYMLWNDWAQQNGESITEEDLFARFAKPLPVLADKLWG